MKSIREAQFNRFSPRRPLCSLKILRETARDAFRISSAEMVSAQSSDVEKNISVKSLKCSEPTLSTQGADQIKVKAGEQDSVCTESKEKDFENIRNRDGTCDIG